MKSITLAISFTIALLGCSDSTPIKIPQQYNHYIGTWQFSFEQISDDAIMLDKMLLSIRADGAASYRKCEISKKQSKGFKTSSRISTEFPEAAVTQINHNKIRIVQAIAGFGIKNDLTIDRAPYKNAEQWHIGIEGKTLSKLAQQEVENNTDWTCPESED